MLFGAVYLQCPQRSLLEDTVAILRIVSWLASKIGCNSCFFTLCCACAVDWAEVRRRVTAADCPDKAMWAEWTRDDVAVWLRVKKLPEPAVRMAWSHSLSGLLLTDITADSLLTVYGVEDGGIRRTMLAELQRATAALRM